MLIMAVRAAKYLGSRWIFLTDFLRIRVKLYSVVILSKNEIISFIMTFRPPLLSMLPYSGWFVGQHNLLPLKLLRILPVLYIFWIMHYRYKIRCDVLKKKDLFKICSFNFIYYSVFKNVCTTLIHFT